MDRCVCVCVCVVFWVIVVPEVGTNQENSWEMLPWVRWRRSRHVGPFPRVSISPCLVLILKPSTWFSESLVWNCRVSRNYFLGSTFHTQRCLRLVNILHGEATPRKVTCTVRRSQELLSSCFDIYLSLIRLARLYLQACSRSAHMSHIWMAFRERETGCNHYTAASSIVSSLWHSPPHLANHSVPPLWADFTNPSLCLWGKRHVEGAPSANNRMY